MTVEELPPFPNHLGPMTLSDARVLLPSIMEDDPELAEFVEAIRTQDAFQLLLIMAACVERVEAINSEVSE